MLNLFKHSASKLGRLGMAVFLCLWPGLLGRPATALTIPAIVENQRLPEMKTPTMQKLRLANGMQVLLFEDHELPIVRGYLYMRTGSLYDAPDKAGLAALTGELLREGGTQARPPEAVEDLLASWGAEIEADVSREHGLLSFKCLSGDVGPLLDLFFELLRTPAFTENKFALLKFKALEQLGRRNDDPAAIAARRFPQLLYGEDSVWARSPDRASLRAIAREDVVSFYQRFFSPDRMVFALHGDFEAQSLKTQLERLNANWQPPAPPLPRPQPVEKKWRPGVYLIPKKTDQVTLVMGHYGERRQNPDKYALSLFNHILGGEPLVSRLGQQVRSNLGLAYHIYSRFGFETDYGLFYVSAQTKAANARRVFTEARALLTELRQGQTLQAEELDFHKAAFLSSLYAAYDPPYRFAQEEARWKFYGYPPHYLEKLRQGLRRASLADLRRVAQNYIDPDNLVVLMVGDPQEIGPWEGLRMLPLEE